MLIVELALYCSFWDAVVYRRVSKLTCLIILFTTFCLVDLGILIWNLTRPDLEFHKVANWIGLWVTIVLKGTFILYVCSYKSAAEKLEHHKVHQN